MTTAACDHRDRDAGGLCPACGDCTHEVILNGACLACGSTDIDPVARSPRQDLIPLDRLRKR